MYKIFNSNLKSQVDLKSHVLLEILKYNLNLRSYIQNFKSDKSKLENLIEASFDNKLKQIFGISGNF